MRIGQKIFTTLMLAVLLQCSGCLEYETYSLSLDIKNRSGEMTFAGLSSNAPNNREFQEDFENLIQSAYFHKDDDEMMRQFKVVSKKLSVIDNKLNAKITFVFKNEITTKALNEIGLDRDSTGNYVTYGPLEDTYVRGNAEVVRQEPNKTVLTWSKKIQKIEYESKNPRAKNHYDTALLSKWIEWEKANLNDQGRPKEMALGSGK